MGPRRIGLVQLLQDRVYGERVAAAGTYPVMLDGAAVFVSFSGYPVVPAGAVEPLAAGVFMIAAVDRVKALASEDFRSREWTIDEFREFLEDPLCLAGPQQRLVFALEEGALAC